MVKELKCSLSQKVTPVPFSSHEKSQAEDKSNTRRTAKPRKSQRKVQNPEEAILEEVVWTKFSPAILNSLFYYLQQKQPVQLNIFLPWFVLLTFLFYLTLLITFWNFFSWGFNPSLIFCSLKASSISMKTNMQRQHSTLLLTQVHLSFSSHHRFIWWAWVSLYYFQ